MFQSLEMSWLPAGLIIWAYKYYSPTLGQRVQIADTDTEAETEYLHVSFKKIT